MSASWSSDWPSRTARRRAYRRPRQSSVPVEIDTQKTFPLPTQRYPVVPPPHKPTAACACSVPRINDNDHADNVWEQTSQRRIEILPGSLLIPEGEPWLHPPEPKDDAPVPTEIIQLLVLGEKGAGKTTLSRRFQQMHYRHFISQKQSIRRTKGEATAKTAALSAFREWSVAYHKKDVTFWQHDHGSKADAVGCARVQLWDVTGGGPAASSSDKPLERRQEWIRLIQKMSAIILVVSLEHGPHSVMETMVAWKQWLDESCPSHCQVHLVLQKSDLLPQQATKPFLWMELGSRISHLCDEIGIVDWRMTTCCTDSAEQSPEEVIIDLVKGLVTTSVPQRRVSFKVEPVSSRDGPGKLGKNLT